MAQGSVTQCTVVIERASEQVGSNFEFSELVLQVMSKTGKVLESFPCTPDGNCFAIVQDLPSFSLKLAGSSHALFEPK